MTSAILRLDAPAAVGGILSGTWRALPPDAVQAEVTVRCQHAYRGNLRHASNVPETLWERVEVTTRTGDHFAFSLRLPEPLPGTTGGDPHVRWLVGVRAGALGTEVEIPVDGRPAKPTEMPLATAPDPADAEAAEALALAAGIGVERTIDRVTYDFRGYRPALSIVANLVALLAFLGAFLALPKLSREPAPSSFLVPWLGIGGSIGGFVILGMLRTLLLRVRVTAGSDGLTIRRGWVLPWRERRVAADEVHGFVHSRPNVNGMVVWWDRRRFVHLLVDHGEHGMVADMRARGRLMLCGWMIPDLRTAQAIEADLARHLGPGRRSYP